MGSNPILSARSESCDSPARRLSWLSVSVWSMRNWIKRHWRWALPVGVVLGAFGAWLIFGYFAFQTLFQDDEVDEALPFFTAGLAPSGMAGDETTSALAAAMNEAMEDDDMPMIQQVDEPMPQMPAAASSGGAASVGSTAPSSDNAPSGGDTAAADDTETTVVPEPETDPPAGEPESQPAAEPETEPDPEPVVTEAPQPQIVVEASGSFIDRSHPTQGSALVLGDGSGQRFLRFEDFRTDNGPDLNVYLSTAPTDASAGQFDDDFIDLGDLKGNVGSQNYEIPADVDLGRYSTVAIWCVRFGVVFGVASLA